MKNQPKPTIRVAAAALAVSACGVAVGIAGVTPVAHTSSVPARYAPADTSRSADLRDLAQVKRDVIRKAMDHARAQPTQTGTSWFAELRELAQVQRDVVRKAAGRASGR